MNNQQIKENPWEAQVAKWENGNMSANCKWILEGDKDFVDAMQNSINESKEAKKSKDWKDNNCLHLELFPEPFLGNPDAPIYLLGGNPGYSGENDLIWLGNDDYLDILKKSIVHEYNTSDTSFGFFDKRIDKSEAAKWWNKHVNEEIRDKIFNIEFFAYHSKKAYGLKKYFDTIDSKNPQPTCASNEYADSLIYKAMREEKILIITRFKTYWFKRIKKLEDYDNLYVLLNHQSALVQSGNLVAYKELERLKKDSWGQLSDV